MYSEIYKKFFNSKHLAISFTGTILGIITTVILFLHAMINDQEIVIAKFSIFLLIFFGTSILCMLGNDIEILAKTNNLRKKKIIIDNKIFKLILSLILNILLFLIYNNFFHIFVVEITFNELLVIHIAIFLNNLNRTFQSYIQSSSKLLTNSILDFSRYVGYAIFLIFWIFKKFQLVGFIFLIGESVTFISLLFFIVFNYSQFTFENKKINFKLNYFILSFSQFAYQGLFKIDILTLALFGNLKLIILYAILSNVIEGIVNFITSFHPAMNNLILKNKKNLISKNDIHNYFSIKKISSFLIILIIPSYLIFNYLVFFNFPEFIFLVIVIFLSISVFISKKLFLFYYVYSLYEKPFNQFLFSIGLLMSNFILNIILFKLIGLLGIAIATSMSYILFNFIIINELKKKKLIFNN